MDDEELYVPRPPVSGEIHTPRGSGGASSSSSSEVDARPMFGGQVPFGGGGMPKANRVISMGGAARAGVGMGTALAIVLSWSRNESIVWAIVHGFLSWVYVIWFAITR